MFLATSVARRPRRVVIGDPGGAAVLVHQVMRDAAEPLMMRLYSRLKCLADLELHDLLIHGQVDLQALVRRHDGGGTAPSASPQSCNLARLDASGSSPRSDRLDHDLRAFFSGSGTYWAVAFGGLRPELAGDLDDGMRA